MAWENIDKKPLVFWCKDKKGNVLRVVRSTEGFVVFTCPEDSGLEFTKEEFCKKFLEVDKKT